jgi:hypothetical protein
MKVLKIILIILICLASLVGLYLGFVFLVASGFIFAGDIDLTDEQRNAAQKWVILGSLFGLVLMIISTFTIVLSGKIANFTLKLFGKNS